jgi:hypothetical protein
MPGEISTVQSLKAVDGPIAMTLDTYSHVLPSMQRDAADKLDALFEGKVGA